MKISTRAARDTARPSRLPDRTPRPSRVVAWPLLLACGMTTRLPAILVLLPFLVFSVWCTLKAEEGFVGFFTMPWTHPIWSQEFVDLCIALTMVQVFMFFDARRRGATIWPYLVATPLLGSISPLVYFALRAEPITTSRPPTT
jgi:hypothetical protein